MLARLPLATLCAALLVFAACERGPQPAAEESAAAEAAPIAGRYEVAGTTVDIDTGNEREISGTVNLFELPDPVTPCLRARPPPNRHDTMPRRASHSCSALACGVFTH